MSTINVKLDSPILKCDFTLEKRLSIITGDSGIGKTTLVKLLQDKPNGVFIQSTYPIIVANNSGWHEMLKGASDTIIIFDSLIASETQDFVELFEDYVVRNNNYVIAFSRADSLTEALARHRCVYTILNKNGTLVIEPECESLVGRI